MKITSSSSFDARKGLPPEAPKSLRYKYRHLVQPYHSKMLSWSLKYWRGFDQLPFKRLQKETRIIDAAAWGEHIDVKSMDSIQELPLFR